MRTVSLSGTTNFSDIVAGFYFIIFFKINRKFSHVQISDNITIVLYYFDKDSSSVKFIVKRISHRTVIACIHRITVNITVCINYINSIVAFAVIVIRISLRNMSCHIG